MAGSGNSFVDEIYDQFLVCRMCSEVFKNPKVLTCMHTFCEKCLESHHEMEEQERPYRFLLYARALTCPLCHSRTELPTGGVHRLPDNFLVANLSDVVSRRKPGPEKDPMCEICRPSPLLHNEADREADAEKRAVAKCLDCVKLLCRGCTELHRVTRVTRNHGLFDVQVEKDAECKIHQGEVLRFYCEPCEECICVLCTFHDHQDHEVSSMVDALERHRGPFEELMGQCRGRIEGLREQVELIDRCEKGLKQAEDHIRDSAIESIAAIRKREKDLLCDLRDTLGDQTIEFIAEKNTFKENLKNIEGTFNLTSSMLKGTKIDLLIVKKEMEKKLNAILDTGVRKTPESLKRNVLSNDADHYLDVRQSGFDQMARVDQFVGPITGSSTPEHQPPKQVEVRSIATETDDDVTPKPEHETDEEEDDDEEAETPDGDLRRDSVWQRPMAVVVVTEIPRSYGTITLRPITGQPRTKDGGTQTPRVVLVDDSTEMPPVILLDKESNTPTVHLIQKGVSTDNQAMVDKSTTTTMVDVGAVYRGAATTMKRPVMVSRGTCTPKVMSMDKETIVVPSSTSTRSCSPIVWTDSNSNTNVRNSSLDDGVTAIEKGVDVDSLAPSSSNSPPLDSTSGESSQDQKIIASQSPGAVPGSVNPPGVRIVVNDASKAQTQSKNGDIKQVPLAATISRPVSTTATNPMNQSSSSIMTKPGQGQVPMGTPVERIATQSVGNTPVTQNKVQSCHLPTQQAALMVAKAPLNLTPQGHNPAPALSPASLPGFPSTPVIQGNQVRIQVPTNAIMAQSVPGTQLAQVRMTAPTTVPGPQLAQVRVPVPTTVPGTQSVARPQGNQVRIPGPSITLGYQPIPGAAPVPRVPGNQVRNTVPATSSVSGVLFQPPVQGGAQVRNQDPKTVLGSQCVTPNLPVGPVPVNLSGTQLLSGYSQLPGGQGSMSANGVQIVPGTQGPRPPLTAPNIHSTPAMQIGQVRTTIPTTVPLPGTQRGQVRPNTQTIYTAPSVPINNINSPTYTIARTANPGIRQAVPIETKTVLPLPNSALPTNNPVSPYPSNQDGRALVVSSAQTATFAVRPGTSIVNTRPNSSPSTQFSAANFPAVVSSKGSVSSAELVKPRTENSESIQVVNRVLEVPNTRSMNALPNGTLQTNPVSQSVIKNVGTSNVVTPTSGTASINPGSVVPPRSNQPVQVSVSSPSPVSGSVVPPRINAPVQVSVSSSNPVSGSVVPSRNNQPVQVTVSSPIQVSGSVVPPRSNAPVQVSVSSSNPVSGSVVPPESNPPVQMSVSSPSPVAVLLTNVPAQVPEATPINRPSSKNGVANESPPGTHQKSMASSPSETTANNSAVTYGNQILPSTGILGLNNSHIVSNQPPINLPNRPTSDSPNMVSTQVVNGALPGGRVAPQAIQSFLANNTPQKTYAAVASSKENQQKPSNVVLPVNQIPVSTNIQLLPSVGNNVPGTNMVTTPPGNVSSVGNTIGANDQKESSQDVVGQHKLNDQRGPLTQP